MSNVVAITSHRAVVRPAPRSEADYYADLFSQARGLMVDLLTALNEPDERLRAAMTEYAKLHAEHVLEGWNKS